MVWNLRTKYRWNDKPSGRALEELSTLKRSRAFGFDRTALHHKVGPSLVNNSLGSRWRRRHLTMMVHGLQASCSPKLILCSTYFVPLLVVFLLSSFNASVGFDGLVDRWFEDCIIDRRGNGERHGADCNASDGKTNGEDEQINKKDVVKRVKQRGWFFGQLDQSSFGRCGGFRSS